MNKINKNEDLKKEVPNNLDRNGVQEGPKVIFENLESQVEMGMWLGTFSPKSYYERNEYSDYLHLSAKEFITKVNIPQDKLQEIEKTFAHFLRLMGIDSTETCVLKKEVNEYDKFFNCYMKNKGDLAKIVLNWGEIDDFATITMESQNESKTYSYAPETEQLLFLEEYTIKENENSCQRVLSSYGLVYIKK